MMYCPKCAAPASSDQNFCRCCGLGLQEVSRLFVDRSPAAESDEILAESVDYLQHRQQRLQQQWFITLIGIVVLAIVGVFMNFSRIGALPTSIILLVFLLGYLRFLRQRSAGRQLSPPTLSPRPSRTKKLQPHQRSQSIPSVTEHTTELLETSEEQAPAVDTARQRE